MKLTLAEAAIGAGAVLEAPASVANAGALVVTGYSIDSRTVAPGELFFAVRGDRLDGHDFVVAAVRARSRGRGGFARARRHALSDAALAVPLLIVEDPLIALQALAAHVRRQWGKRVVAVIGSAGKTTTKEAIAIALGAKFKVLKSQGNLNNGFGLPLQLLRLEPEDEFAVIEMGMNHPGEIAALARIAGPDWGVVTNVGTAHIENFADGQAGIARAKFEMVDALPSNGVAFLNCDDPYVSQFGRDFHGRAVYFGSGPCADPRLLEVTEDLAGLALAHSRRRAREPAHAENAGRAQRDERSGRSGRCAGGGRRSGRRRCRAPVADHRRQARRSHQDGRRNHSERQLQLQPRGAPFDDPHPGRAPRRAAAFWWRAKCWKWANTDPRCTPPADAPPLKPVSTWSSVSVATPSTWPRRPAQAESRRCFCPTPRLPGAGSSQNLQPGDVVLVKGSRGVHLERAIEALTRPSETR